MAFICNVGEPKTGEFYDFWTRSTSAQLSEPSVTCTEFLRNLHPGVAVVGFTDKPSFQVEKLPGVKITSLDPQSISVKEYAATARRLLREGRSPGEIVDVWKFAALKLEWENDLFLCYIVSYPKGEYACTVTVHFLVHHNAERCHALLEAAGAWKIQLNEEILFYDDGYWQSSHALWAEVQKADWSEVVMKEEFKEQVMEDVQGFFRSEDLYKSLSVPWKRGIIIHGPPGNGKTLTVKAVMKACIEQGFAPLYVKSFRHETSDETAMVDVFDKARKMAPCIMVLEDLDALITDKNRSFFLNQLDGLEGNDGLLLIASTNHLNKLDVALSGRPSRFDRKFAFDDPDERERALYMKYWQKKLENNPIVQFTDSLADELVATTAGFSFAYLKEVVISSLVLLANSKHATGSFGNVAKGQIKDLRLQMERTRGHFATEP
ncbi:P-loop containing nucleoside triphosphate hydrolase protein [Fomitopsis betulina]|nr:P-loop containing nucleoside triphosphate hydrolase protein [Fomitopsis betulina]